MKKHFIHSSFREKLIEHLFIGEMLKRSWRLDDCALEVGRPEVDNSGYDIILEHNGIIRHVQLKATKKGGRTSRQHIHLSLTKKQSGCVVWIFFDEVTLELGPYLFLGGKPGKKLPALAKYKSAKHTKEDSTGVKSERPNLRVVPKANFKIVKTDGDIWRALFGNGK